MWFYKISKVRCYAKSVEKILKSGPFNAGVSNSIRMVGHVKMNIPFLLISRSMLVG